MPTVFEEHARCQGAGFVSVALTFSALRELISTVVVGTVAAHFEVPHTGSMATGLSNVP